MSLFNKNNTIRIGFAKSDRPPDQDKLTPAEREMLEKVADRLLQEHRETLKNLGDE